MELIDLTKLEQDVEIIQALPTQPNQEEGMSAADLQKKFDEAAVIIKSYLNEKVVPAFLALKEYAAQLKTDSATGFEGVQTDIAELEQRISQQLDDVNTIIEDLSQVTQNSLDDLSQDIIDTHKEIQNLSQAVTERLEKAEGDIAYNDARLTALMQQSVNFAGTIECTASGTVVSVADASEERLQEVIADGGGEARVWVYGKNLLNIDAMLNECLTANGNGTYRIKRLEDGYMSATQTLFLPAGTYMFSVSKTYRLNSIDGTGYLYFYAIYEDGAIFTGRILQEGWTSRQVTFEKNVIGLRLYIYPTETTDSNVVFRDLQLEAGGTPTAYEPYKPVQMQTVTAGTPLSLCSNKPNTTIVSDRNVSVRYVADTKTYIDQEVNSAAMPDHTNNDNGKFLQVVNGRPAWVSVADSAVKNYIDEYISSALEGDY